MNIFNLYLDKIKKIVVTANKNNLIEIPENLDGINVDLPPSKFDCDISTNVAMFLSKVNKKPPDVIAKKLIELIKKILDKKLAYEKNGSVLTPTRDELHALQDERCLVYHRSGTTVSWGKVTMGHYNSDDDSLWNIDKAKFSEMIWYDSDQHANQAGIESNINTHYSIY